MNYDIEKLRQLAEVTPESELDEMFDDDISGAGKKTIPLISVVGCPVMTTIQFDWCPTSACTSACRVG